MLLILRLVLARSTRPTDPSPQATPAATKQLVAFGDDELEQYSDLAIPRLSLPIDDGEEGHDDDDSFRVPPPRLSVPLDDDTYTQDSVEVARRAISEQPYGRFSRGSFGSIRMSDRYADINELGLDAVSYVSAENSTTRPGFDTEYDDSLEQDEGLDPGCVSIIRALARIRS